MWWDGAWGRRQPKALTHERPATARTPRDEQTPYPLSEKHKFYAIVIGSFFTNNEHHPVAFSPIRGSACSKNLMKKNTRDVNVLRVGFMTGYYTRYDVSCWVDEQILKEDQPSNKLIELSLLKTKNEQEIEFLLRQLGDARDPVQDFKYAIGFVGLLFETRKLSLSVAVQTLFNKPIAMGLLTSQALEKRSWPLTAWITRRSSS